MGLHLRLGAAGLYESIVDVFLVVASWYLQRTQGEQTLIPIGCLSSGGQGVGLELFVKVHGRQQS